MDKDRPKQQYTLQEWEQELQAQVRQVELLGEISLAETEIQQLGRQLGQLIRIHRGWGINGVCELIGKKYGCALAVFLVSQGVNDANADNGFWSDVAQTLGQPLDSNWHRHLGLLFEEILVQHGLPLFPDMGGYRYVSLILLHGGIPNYALFDYFQHLLRPAVTRPDYVELPPAELIEEWLHHSSGRYFSDKPVLRFLQYGGQVAVDFVERTRELAQAFLESRLVPPAEQVGLPQRVTEAFYRWAVEEQGLEDISQPQSGLRIRRPEIRLDPWGEGFSLDLLPQQIPATLSQARIRWEVRLDGQLEPLPPVRLERVGYHLQTPAESLVLERAVSLVEVALLFDGEVRRSWSYPLTGPLLVFDPAHHTLLRWKVSLPARPLWLLYPQDTALEITGPADKLVEFPAFPWGWAGFKGEVWDLSQASQLALRRGEEVLADIPIRPDEATQRPHLTGGQLHQTFTLIGIPLYLGSPPAIRIPLVGRTTPEEEIGRWRLTLYNPWPASPNLELRRVPLSELRQHLSQGEGYLELPLNSPALLGDSPMGSYTIRLRGPLGRDAELSFRLLPHLYLTGHEQLYVPDPVKGPEDVELLIEAEAGIHLEAQVEELPCRVQRLRQAGASWLHQVRVPPALTEARLVAVKAQPGGEAVRVPLHVPLRRLRWALTGDTDRADAQRLDWSGRPLKQSLDALEQTVAPVLFVDFGHAGGAQDASQATVGLYLVDLEGRELQVKQLARPIRDPDNLVWRFELIGFLDMIRQTPSPAVHFELEWNSEEAKVRLPVLSLTRSMQVDEVQLRVQADGLSLTWQEPVWLRNRRVRFWPAWQPWRPYREEIIPDGAQGTLRLQMPEPELLVGKYLLEFLIVDPWAPPQTPLHPPGQGPNLAPIVLTPPEERLQQIEQAIQTVGPAFHLFLEHAFVEADRGQVEAALADLWQCYHWFEQATLQQILAMVELVQRTDDKRLLTLLRLKMSKPDRLRQLIQAYSGQDIPPHYLDAYRDQVLLRTGLWPAESCEILLDFPYEPVQLFALMHLIRRGAQSGGQTVLERVKHHHLSDADGADLFFEINPNFAVAFLGQHLADPEAQRLLIRLTERDPERDWPFLLVRSGYFIRSYAGWGRIDRIEIIEENREARHFLKGETGFRLRVTLRPGHDNVPVTIEVLADRQRLLFKADLTLYACGKSNDCTFVTPDQELFYNGHNKAAHEGIGAKYLIKKSPLVSIQPVEYRPRAPQDILH